MATSPPTLQPFSLPPFTAHPSLQSMASTSTAAPSSASVSSKEKQPRRRLPATAKMILEGWILEHEGTEKALRPTPAEKRALLAKIQTLDGADWYSYQNVDRFFISRRKSNENHLNGDVKRRGRKPKSAVESEITRAKNWPSLNAEALKRLPGLLQTQSDPDDNMINMWVVALPGAATANDVRKWIQHKKTEVYREEISEDEDEDPRAQHLPTPEPTASPEPVYNGLPSPVGSLRASPASPVIPQNAPWATAYTRPGAAPTKYVWQVPATSTPYIASVPPGATWRPSPTLAAYAQTKPLQNPAPTATTAGPSGSGSAAAAALFKELAQSVKDALSAPESEPQDATCATPADFMRRFEPHERRFEEFLEKTQRGEYAALGLLPTMIPKDVPTIKSEGYEPMDED